MKNKLLLVVVLVVAIYVSISIRTVVSSTFSVESVNSEVAVSDQYFANVNRSVEIQEQLIDIYREGTATHNGKDFSVYCDNFAGIYIDTQGILNIAVVGDLQSKTQQTLPNGGQIIYNQVAFSYNYLQKIMNAIENIMDFYSIRAVGIDDQLNHVFVEMNDERDVAYIVEYLQGMGLYDKFALSFEVDPYGKTVEDANTAYGGESISRRIDATTISRGTVGVNAVCNITGRLGVLTNEHVAPLGSTMSYRGHHNPTSGAFSRNHVLGDTLRAENGGSVDAAFVPFTTQQNWAITPYGRYDTTSYTNVRLGTENQIISGLPVMRIGQTTGVTTGKIRSTNVTETVGGIRKTNLFRYTNYGLGGDSGGPVYYNDGTNRHLIGLHFASGDVFLGGKQGIACRILNVATALNVTIITNDSFNTTNLSNGGIEVNQVNFNTTGAFVIPSEIKGKIVTSVGASAFSNQNYITRVEIPASVTEIKSSAFENRTTVLEVVFESISRLETIGSSAFSGCTGLSQITVPASVTRMGSNAFENTNNASIYLDGRTSVPVYFDINWNSSINPVYLNGTLCTHTSKTTTELNTTQHGDLCNHCRTLINKMSHRKYTSGEWEYCHDCPYSRFLGHTHSYTYTWLNLQEHKRSCSCGDSRTTPHIISGSWNGQGYTTCLACGGPADGGIILQGIDPRLKIESDDSHISHYFGN